MYFMCTYFQFSMPHGNIIGNSERITGDTHDTGTNVCKNTNCIKPSLLTHQYQNKLYH